VVLEGDYRVKMLAAFLGEFAALQMAAEERKHGRTIARCTRVTPQKSSSN
jgi:hypothetical protein